MICRIIFDLTKSIREYMGCLFILCENIAELDLLACFAQSSRNFNFVRPSFSLDCLNLKLSEHPIIHRVCLTKPVPNDVVRFIRILLIFLTCQQLSDVILISFVDYILWSCCSLRPSIVICP